MLENVRNPRQEVFLFKVVTFYTILIRMEMVGMSGLLNEKEKKLRWSSLNSIQIN